MPEPLAGSGHLSTLMNYCFRSVYFEHQLRRPSPSERRSWAATVFTQFARKSTVQQKQPFRQGISAGLMDSMTLANWRIQMLLAIALVKTSIALSTLQMKSSWHSIVLPDLT
jgi:hypothetical protein